MLSRLAYLFVIWAGTVVIPTHCGAGCMLGDLIAEWIVFAAALCRSAC